MSIHECSPPDRRPVVACINWGHPDAPHAVSYVLAEGSAIGSVYHDTWDQAMQRANELAVRIKGASMPQYTTGGGNQSGIPTGSPPQYTTEEK